MPTTHIRIDPNAAQTVSLEDYASGNYLIQGEAPRRRTLTTFQYGRPFEFREGDPIPSERELRSLIRDHMTRKYNASDVDVLKLVHWK